MNRAGEAEVGDIYESRDPRDCGRQVVVVAVEGPRYARVKRVGVQGGVQGYRIQHETLRNRYALVRREWVKARG